MRAVGRDEFLIKRYVKLADGLIKFMCLGDGGRTGGLQGGDNCFNMSWGRLRLTLPGLVCLLDYSARLKYKYNSGYLRRKQKSVISFMEQLDESEGNLFVSSTVLMQPTQLQLASFKSDVSGGSIKAKRTSQSKHNSTVTGIK